MLEQLLHNGSLCSSFPRLLPFPASLVDMDIWSKRNRTSAFQEDTLDLKWWMKPEPSKVVSGNGNLRREWVGWANGSISLELCGWTRHILGWGYVHAQWRPGEGLSHLHTPGWPWHCPQYPQQAKVINRIASKLKGTKLQKTPLRKIKIRKINETRWNWEGDKP